MKRNPALGQAELCQATSEQSSYIFELKEKIEKEVLLITSRTAIR